MAMVRSVLLHSLKFASVIFIFPGITSVTTATCPYGFPVSNKTHVPGLGSFVFGFISRAFVGYGKVFADLVRAYPTQEHKPIGSSIFVPKVRNCTVGIVAYAGVGIAFTGYRYTGPT